MMRAGWPGAHGCWHALPPWIRGLGRFRGLLASTRTISVSQLQSCAADLGLGGRGAGFGGFGLGGPGAGIRKREPRGLLRPRPALPSHRRAFQVSLARVFRTAPRRALSDGERERESAEVGVRAGEACGAARGAGRALRPPALPQVSMAASVAL
eukprot:832850-Rhodomonas_salina.2